MKIRARALAEVCGVNFSQKGFCGFSALCSHAKIASSIHNSVVLFVLLWCVMWLLCGGRGYTFFLLF